MGLRAPWRVGWWLLLLAFLASTLVKGEAPVLPPSGITAASAREPGSISHGQQPGTQRPRVPVFTVAWMATAMAMASSLGVLPFFFVGKLSKPWAGAANSVACGVMIAASFGLLEEGAHENPVYLIGGMLLGAAFVSISEATLEQYEVESFEELAGAEARKVILFLAVMAAHALGEGSGVGVSFAGQRGWAQGTLVTLAIGLHNVPEGLAVATVMAAKGATPQRALLWTTLTAAPQALVAVPAYLFVDQFKALLPLALGFAAGCMLWIVFAELLPDALEALPSQQVASAVTCAAAGLKALSIYIAQLEQPDGHLASPFHAPPQLPGGASKLLALAPVAVLPAAAAAMAASHVLPSRPVQLGFTTGLLVATGLLQWLHALVASQQVALAARMLLPVAGCVLAMGAYAAYPNLSRRPSSGGSPGASPALGEASQGHWQAKASRAEYPLEQQQQQSRPDQNGYHNPQLTWQQQQHEADFQGHANGHAIGHVPQSVDGSSPVVTAAVVPKASPWPGGATAHLRVGAGPRHAGREVEVYSSISSPRKLLARSLSAGVPAPRQAPGSDEEEVLLPLTLMPGDLVPARTKGRRGVQQLVAVSWLGPVLAGAAQGLLLGHSLATVGRPAPAALPVAVAGVLSGLTVMGLLSQLMTARKHVAAHSSALAAVPVVLAGCLLLGNGAAASSWHLWAVCLQLLAVGYNMACGALFCWPAAREWNKDRAAAGAVAGSLLAVVFQGLLAGACRWWNTCLLPS